MTRYVAPDILDAFNCPYCGAFAHQRWFKLYAAPYNRNERPWTEELVAHILATLDSRQELSEEDEEEINRSCEAFRAGLIRVPPKKAEGQGTRLQNLDVGRCFSCEKFSVWVAGRLIHPRVATPILPNQDMNDDIQRDFREAGEILALSPRGSAALLRLCVQKLCKQLGEPGKNINSDIAALVRKGLDVRIQQALDVVRVIGNESVHPGQIRLEDDTATAGQLFGLVNLIADAMITQPKAVEALYQKLPPGKLQEIGRRDANQSTHKGP